MNIKGPVLSSLSGSCFYFDMTAGCLFILCLNAPVSLSPPQSALIGQFSQAWAVDCIVVTSQQEGSPGSSFKGVFN